MTDEILRSSADCDPDAIPWYVNNTLSHEDRQKLEGHIESCEACSVLLAQERAIEQGLRSRMTVDYAPHASLAKLTRRIDAGGKRGDEDEAVTKGRDWRSWFVPALLLQSAAVAVLAFVLWQLATGQPSDSYQTRSSATAAIDAHYQVVFDDDVTAGSIRESLAFLSATIVDGPSEAGVFLVAVDADPQRDADETLVQLRQMPGVVFAAAVEGSAK